MNNKFKNLSKNIYLFLIINLIYYLSVGIFNMFIGIYLKEIGYSESFVGNILSINILSIAIASIPSAYIIEKIGIKKSFTLGFLLIALGASGIVIFKHPFIIVFMAILNGFGLSIKSTAEGMYITENTNSQQRVKVFSLNFMITNVGMMIASYLGGLCSSYLSNFINKSQAITIIFIVSSIIVLLSLIPIYFMEEKQDLKPRSMKNCIKGYKQILNKKVLSFTTCNFLVGCGAGMVVPFFSVYLKYAVGISDSDVGTILSLSQFGCIVGAILIPYIATKMGKHRSVVLCQILSIPFLISIAFPQGIIILTISFFMRNGLMNMANPIIQDLSMELVDKENRTNMSSVMSISFNISRSIGIMIGGYIMEMASYNTPYYIAILFYLVSILLFSYLYRGEVMGKGTENREVKGA